MMDLHVALSEVENRIKIAEENARWLAFEFLTDEAFTPRGYLERSLRQKVLLRDLESVAELLESEDRFAAAA
jgi:hypothetical protein